MWRNLKFCQIWRNFKILHMTDVKKSEIYPVFGCEICFVAIYANFRVICFVAIYALLRGKKLSRKLYRWRKNYKYEVCKTIISKMEVYHRGLKNIIVHTGHMEWFEQMDWKGQKNIIDWVNHIGRIVKYMLLRREGRRYGKLFSVG